MGVFVAAAGMRLDSQEACRKHQLHNGMRGDGPLLVRRAGCC
jgi:hypothetical protein